MQVRILDEFIPRHRGFDAAKTYEVHAFDRGQDSTVMILVVNDNHELKWLEASHTRVQEPEPARELVGA